MRIGRGVTLTTLFVTASYCRSVDLPVPWDKADIARDVSADLRKFERLNSDLAEVEKMRRRFSALDIHRTVRGTPFSDTRGHRPHTTSVRSPASTFFRRLKVAIERLLRQ